MNNVNITVDGHLDITNSLVNVKNAAFGSDAILSLKINTLDDYGLFVADSVSFADKAHFKVTLADNLVKIGEEVDIQLLRSSEGNFAAFDDTFDNNLYHFTRKNDDGWYTIRLVKTARQLVAENGGSLTQQDVAGAWVDSRRPNQSEFAAKFRDAAQNDVNKFIDNLTAIAPSEAPIVQAMEADNDGLFSMIATHLRNDQYVANPVGYNAYAPYQQYPQYQRPVYYRQQYRAPQQYQPRYDANGYTYGLPSGDLVNPAQIWLNAYKGKAKFSDGQRQSFDTDKTGIVAALEKRFTPSFKAAAGYSYETGKVDAFRRDVDVDSHKLFAFYEYKPNHFFINGAAAYAMSSYKEDKEVFDKSVHASYDTTTISAQTLLGYETRYFTPEMGVRAYFIDRDGYTDSAEQKVTSNNMSIVRGVAGVRAGVDIDMGNCRKLRPELYVGVNYDFVGDKDEAVITLPNGETYSMEGRSLGKFGIETGAGISADFTQRFSLSARYAGDYRDKYKSHTGMIGMKYKF
jgi:outer membrane autotransporter protein